MRSRCSGFDVVIPRGDVRELWLGWCGLCLCRELDVPKNVWKKSPDRGLGHLDRGSSSPTDCAWASVGKAISIKATLAHSLTARTIAISQHENRICQGDPLLKHILDASVLKEPHQDGKSSRSCLTDSWLHTCWFRHWTLDNFFLLMTRPAQLLRVPGGGHSLVTYLGDDHAWLAFNICWARTSSEPLDRNGVLPASPPYTRRQE